MQHITHTQFLSGFILISDKDYAILQTVMSIESPEHISIAAETAKEYYVLTNKGTGACLNKSTNMASFVMMSIDIPQSHLKLIKKLLDTKIVSNDQMLCLSSNDIPFRSVIDAITAPKGKRKIYKISN